MLRRREFIGATALAVSSLALRHRLTVAAEAKQAGLLAPQPGHHPARADHLIFVFLTGGFSHVDTFDPKPRLSTDHGKTVPGPTLRESTPKPLLGSPFAFRKCGTSGLPISEIFPRLGQVADDLCVFRSLHTDIVEHFQATLAMHTGSATVPLPSIGAWLSYGLGTYNRNLPSYLVFAEHFPYAGAQVWDSHFLPPIHQGVRIIPGPEPIPNLKSPVASVRLQELEQTLLRDANELHAQTRPGDDNLRTRAASFAIAQGMMRDAADIFSVHQESKATLDLYGVAPGDQRSIGWQCLTARRLVERGVRVVEIIDTGAHDNWDAHGDMAQHRGKAVRVDQPLAALLLDLKRTGLLQKTLVAICTEFGRTPFTDAPGTKGRNHYAKAFSVLLAGAGVKGGIAHGATDEYGLNIVNKPVHVHDYHATILHLMGIEHTQLTYRYGGRDFRLTDVAGTVQREVLT